MKHIQTYEKFITESLILEFGDASNPFTYKADVKPDTYFKKLIKKAIASKELLSDHLELDQMDAPALTFTVFGDKATYVVSFAGYISSARFLPGIPEANRPLPWYIEYEVSFNVKDSEEETETNFGEQYRLMATVTQTCLDFINAATEAGIKVKTLGMFPKNDEGSNSVSTASRRGRLYLEYIKKNIKKLSGNWTAELAKDGIILHNGTISGGDKEWIYNK